MEMVLAGKRDLQKHGAKDSQTGVASISAAQLIHALRDCKIVGKIKSCCSPLPEEQPYCVCQGCTELQDLIRKHFNVGGTSVPAQLRQGQRLGMQPRRMKNEGGQTFSL